MFARGWSEGVEAWKWRRRLWAWEEEMVVECRNLLLTVICRLILTMCASGFVTQVLGI